MFNTIFEALLVLYYYCTCDNKTPFETSFSSINTRLNLQIVRKSQKKNNALFFTRVNPPFADDKWQAVARHQSTYYRPQTKSFIARSKSGYLLNERVEQTHRSAIVTHCTRWTFEGCCNCFKVMIKLCDLINLKVC